LLAFTVLLFAVGAAYGALILATRVDEILFPGNGIHVNLPGADNSSGGSGVGKDRINILVMGLDRRPREGQALTRSDTMFVLTVDPQTKTAGILGIPRDLYVEIPDGDGGYFKDRINTALVFGEVNDYKGGGHQLAIDTVEHNLGVKIGHYVIIDFEGFKEVIDALGGIDVDVPTYVSDPTYSWTELPGDYDPQEFEPGLQHMDGETALAYARIRQNSDDLDRIQRQQRIIFAVMDKALGLNVLRNALELWNKYKDAIDTDINDIQLAGFAKLAADISPEKISALSLGPATTPWMTPGGASVLLPSAEGIARIVQALFSDQQLLEEQAVVEVQNCTGETGMADSTVKLLTNLGFPQESLIAAATPNGDVFPTTSIVDFSGQKKGYTLQKLADWLRVPADGIRQPTAADEGLRTSNADILVLLGSDTDITSLSSSAGN
jgi:polyisoprenyl-teichoic acid--peptidoglycan teichoic acid transferase